MNASTVTGPRRLLLLSVLFAGVAGPARAEDETWKAGVAKAVINARKEGVGWRATAASACPDGKLHDLWMKALALKTSRAAAWCSSPATSRASRKR